MAVDYERRGAPRIRAPGTRIELPDLQPRLRDLSWSGAYVEDPRPLRPGRIVQMRIWLSEKACVTVRGAMVRRAEEGTGMGIEFLEMSDADRALLRNFIDAAVQGERPQFF